MAAPATPGTMSPAGQPDHPALAAPPAPDHWIQLGLALPGRPSPPLYARLGTLAHHWLGTGLVRDLFFMHKPPGLRLRFAAAPGHHRQLRDQLRAHADTWRTDGLVTRARFAVYEPEAHLFGGPRSMTHVHRLFTADSITWLDHHTNPTTPAWALSLTMLRTVLDGLRVTDWEDRDVWARVAAAGRRLRTGTPHPDTTVAATRLRHLWDHPTELTAALDEPAQRLAARHAHTARPLLDAWWTGYFGTEHAVLGPRQAAAHYIVFHWNRAALSPARQVLLTESLAALDGGTADAR